MNQLTERGTPASRLGKLIRSSRENAGWSQYFLAEALQVSQGTVSKWETGALVPSASDLAELFALLDDLEPTRCFRLIREHRQGLKPGGAAA